MTKIKYPLGDNLQSQIWLRSNFGRPILSLNRCIDVMLSSSALITSLNFLCPILEDLAANLEAGQILEGLHFVKSLFKLVSVQYSHQLALFLFSS